MTFFPLDIVDLRGERERLLSTSSSASISGKKHRRRPSSFQHNSPLLRSIGSVEDDA